jgi:hypothetical protein
MMDYLTRLIHQTGLSLSDSGDWRERQILPDLQADPGITEIHEEVVSSGRQAPVSSSEQILLTSQPREDRGSVDNRAESTIESQVQPAEHPHIGLTTPAAEAPQRASIPQESAAPEIDAESESPSVDTPSRHDNAPLPEAPPREAILRHVLNWVASNETDISAAPTDGLEPQAIPGETARPETDVTTASVEPASRDIGYLSPPAPPQTPQVRADERKPPEPPKPETTLTPPASPPEHDITEVTIGSINLTLEAPPADPTPAAAIPIPVPAPTQAAPAPARSPSLGDRLRRRYIRV